MARNSVKVEGIDELDLAIDEVLTQIRNNSVMAITKTAENLAQDIKVVYKGGSSPGFKDRSGALRESIVGGFLSEDQDTVVGFVGAGNDSIGSDKKATRNYVTYIEFGEFTKAGSTSFLRSGVMRFQKSIVNSLIHELSKGLED